MRTLEEPNFPYCFYRGKIDMPTELHAASPSVDAGPTFLQFEKETGENEME